MLKKIREIKKAYKVIFFISFALIIAFTSEYFIFNRNILSLPQNERVIETISADQIIVSESEDQKLIKIEFDEKYVGRLIINTESKNPVSGIIEANRKDLYNIYRIKNITFGITDDFNKIVREINANVQEIKIAFTSNDMIISEISIDNTLNINYYRISFFAITILTLGLLLIFKDTFFKKMENKFLLLALVLGGFIIGYSPNSSWLSPDGQIHYYNAITLFNLREPKLTHSEYRMTDFASRRILISSTSTEERRALNQFLNENHQNRVYTFDGFGFTLYRQIGYVPAALGLSIADLLDLSFTTSLQLGKIFNFLFYVTLMYFAIKIAPTKQLLFLVFALLPQNLFLAANFSMDSFITACLTLGFALFLREYFSKEKINITNIMLMIGLFMIGSFPKMVYSPIILLLLLFKKDKFRIPKISIKFKIAIVVLFGLMMSTFVLPTLLSPPVIADTRMHLDTSVADQLSLIMNYPIDYARVLYNNAGPNIFERLIFGSSIRAFVYFGSFRESFALLIVLMFAVASMISFDKKEIKSDKKLKVVTIGIALLTYVMIWTALYLSFSPVGSPTIYGVASRYFLPILIILGFISTLINSSDEKKQRNITMILSILLFILTSAEIYRLILIPYCT